MALHRENFRAVQRAVCAMAMLGAAWLATAPPDARAQGADPFELDAGVRALGTQVVVRLAFTVPGGHFLYVDKLHVAGADEQPLTPVRIPVPEREKDPFSDAIKEVYTRDFEALFAWPDPGATQAVVVVDYQGCNSTVCFFPQHRTFTLDRPAGTPPPVTGGEAGGAKPTAPTHTAPAASAPGTGAPDGLEAALSGFTVRDTATGYMNAGDFRHFLAGGRSSGFARLLERGWPLALLLILLGGIALNLTPCVLPMIPVNLAIIGAGARAGSRRRGFLLGGTYGLAMALVYGVLGLVVVLTGSTFGTLNASPWFNAVVALVFVLMALAMFDVIQVDLSRFQQGMPVDGARKRGGAGRFALAFVLGGLAALLAGACVAPVLIAVLLLAASLYAKGVWLGLLLPFLLGIGMGLPWPFAGAGLSFLPKPGRWMTVVKSVLGVFILAMAGYYGFLAWRGFHPPAPPAAEAGTGAPGGGAKRETIALSAGSGAADWKAAFDRAREEEKPVFIDFWATWCKNCEVMDRTTFRDPKLKQDLARFVVIRYQAEQPNQPPAKPVLDRFGVLGLPTYVVLAPPPNS